MKLVSLNVELGRHTEKVLSFLKQEKADVICLQELLDGDFEFYKKELEMNGVFQLLNYVGDNNHLECRGKGEGLAIFAKNIHNSGSEFYIGSEEKIIETFKNVTYIQDLKANKAILWVDIFDKNNKLFRFITTHFVVTKDGESTPYQLEALDLLFEKLSPLREFILCGDMNAPRGKETFNRLANKYKDNIPPEYKTSLDQNLHRVKNLQLMVDGLFTTENYKTHNVKLIHGLSDHMAIVADIIKD